MIHTCEYTIHYELLLCAARAEVSRRLLLDNNNAMSRYKRGLEICCSVFLQILVATKLHLAEEVQVDGHWYRVSRECIDLIQRMLVIDPQYRIQLHDVKVFLFVKLV